MKTWKQIHEQVKELYQIKEQEGLSPRWEGKRDSILHAVQTDDISKDTPSLLKQIAYHCSKRYKLLRDPDIVTDYIYKCLNLIQKNFADEAEKENPYDPQQSMINTFLNTSFTFHIPKEIEREHAKTEQTVAQIKTEQCKGGGDCREVCPEDAISGHWNGQSSVMRVTTNLCCGCSKCVSICIHNSIRMQSFTLEELDENTLPQFTDEIVIEGAEDYIPATAGKSFSPKPYTCNLGKYGQPKMFYPEHYEIADSNERHLTFIEVALCIPIIQEYAITRWKAEQTEDFTDENMTLLMKTRKAPDKVLIKKNGYAKGERGEKIFPEKFEGQSILEKRKY